MYWPSFPEAPTMQTFMTPILPRTPELARTAEAQSAHHARDPCTSPRPPSPVPAGRGPPRICRTGPSIATATPAFFHYLADGPWNRYGDHVDLMPVPCVTKSSMRDHQQQQRPTGSPPVGRLRRTLRMARPAR